MDLIALMCLMLAVDWSLTNDLLGALLTPTLAIFVIVQYKFNRTRSLQATADKRQAVFIAMMTTVGYLLTEGKKDRLDVRGVQERAAASMGVALGSACLFGSDDRLRILEFNRKMRAISTLVGRTEGLHNEEIDALLQWFEREYDSVTHAVAENKGLFWT